MKRFIPGFVLALSACATAPKSTADKRQLGDDASATLSSMIQKDPDLTSTLARAAGYAVFPNIGKGGLVVGAAYGRGVFYQHGRKIGYVELNQGSFGAQAGAQNFAELIVFLRDEDVAKVEGGQFSLGGNASAIALTTGAAASARFANGVAVFVEPKGGLMAELSVSGQKINFQRIDT